MVARVTPVLGRGRADPENIARFLRYLDGLELTDEEMAERQRRAAIGQLADCMRWPLENVFRGREPVYANAAVQSVGAWLEAQRARV